MIIQKVAWIEVQDRKALFVRPKGKTLFINVGGKYEKGESDSEALKREITEEPGAQLLVGTMDYIDMFSAPLADQPDDTVEIKAFWAEVEGVLIPGSEIEEIGWLTSNDGERTTPAGWLILDWLKENELID